MQKTILYLLLLAILGTGVYFFVFKDKETIFGDTEASFRLRDTSEVGEIFLARNNGDEITLTRTDTAWILNKKYKARISNVNNLLGTLSMQQALYPVPENLHNGVIKSLAGSAVKVELYNRKGKKINTFYVGNEAFNYKGTYMLQEGAKTAYVVQIPGFNGYLTPYYSTDFDDWRDRSVINLKHDEVKSFTINYTQEPGNSFSITQDANGLSVATDSTNNSSLNKRRADAYLRFFTDIYCEGYLNGIPGIDSTIASVPKFCEMNVVAKNGWHQHIDIYKMPINKRSKNLNTADDSDYDIDRFYGVINNYKDTVLLQAYTFDKFFRRGIEFYQADPTDPLSGLPTNR
jgi:hypothetical protein